MPTLQTLDPSPGPVELDDLVIGAIGADPNGGFSGQSYVVFGQTGGFTDPFELSALTGANGFALNGITAFG